MLADNSYEFVGRPVSNNKKIDLYFVLGESASSNQMSLYDYKRKITPYLDSLPQEFITKFNNVLSPSSSTFASYEIMFSPSRVKNTKMFFIAPNLIEELKHIGYQVVWQTYHSGRQSVIYESLVRNADFHYSSDDNVDDRKMLVMLFKNLKEEASVYFINMYGSHPYFNVPEDQIYFSEKKSNDKKQDTINRYDNTILALDNFIKRVVKMAEKHKKNTKRPYAIWYVSDHGLVLFKDGSNWAGHSLNSENISGFQIPFFILNKSNLPCGEKLDRVYGENTGSTFEMVLVSL